MSVQNHYEKTAKKKMSFEWHITKNVEVEKIFKNKRKYKFQMLTTFLKRENDCYFYFFFFQRFSVEKFT